MKIGAPLLALAALPPTATLAESASVTRDTLAIAPTVPFCALISEAAARAGGPPRLVSITAIIGDEMHYGYFLLGPDCRDSVGNTGMLHITFPEGQEFRELARMESPEFLRGSLGKRIYCNCIGEISYPHGYPRFVLRRVERIWASYD